MNNNIVHSSSSLKQLFSVQYLRAIAALLVVYCHSIDLQMLYGVSYQQNFLYLQNFGAIGVDIFFIISGFIISYVSLPDVGLKAALSFIKKRFTRINPTYYFATGLLALFMFFSNDFKLPFTPLVKSLTILPIFESGEKYIAPLLTVGWTLSFEWFFYLLFALLMLLGVKAKREIFLVLIFIGLSVVGLLFPFQEQHWLFITNPLFLEFGFGLITAYFFRKYKNVKLKSTLVPRICLALSCIMFVALVVLGYSQVSEAFLILNGNYCWLRVLIWGIPSLFLFVGMLYYEKVIGNKYIQNKFFVLLGNASFSIYLTHEIVFWFIEKYSLSLFMKLDQDLLIFLFMALAMTLGILFHRYVEKSIIKKVKQLVEN